jgi:hypothetical protein
MLLPQIVPIKLDTNANFNISVARAAKVTFSADAARSGTEVGALTRIDGGLGEESIIGGPHRGIGRRRGLVAGNAPISSTASNDDAGAARGGDGIMRCRSFPSGPFVCPPRVDTRQILTADTATIGPAEKVPGSVAWPTLPKDAAGGSISMMAVPHCETSVSRVVVCLCWFAPTLGPRSASSLATHSVHVG